MTTIDKINDKNLQYGIYRKAANLTLSPSGKVDKYEFLTGEEIPLVDQRKVIEQVRLTYSPLRKNN